MAINEVFPNPTVKEVHFQVRFPSLFYIENKVGDFQLKIMTRLPKSALLLRRQFVIADIGPQAKIVNMPESAEPESTQKVWQFSSDAGVTVNLMASSLGIHSQHHTTYDNPTSADRFRDVIQFIVDSFLDVTSIPIISRIGLRYVNECPLPTPLTDHAFSEYYNTAFPLSRFGIADTDSLTFTTIVRRGQNSLRYQEEFLRQGNSARLKLDCDGYRENVKPCDYLSTTDDLHTLIGKEYEAFIRDPVYAFMRTPGVTRNERQANKP